MSSIQYDNIFDAVTADKEASNELQTRSDLMIVLRDIIDDNNWKQDEAAEKLGITQPRVSDLKRGKIEVFSIDLLMKCLYRVGFRIKPTYANHRLSVDVQKVSNF